jgi:hypothetical protein
MDWRGKRVGRRPWWLRWRRARWLRFEREFWRHVDTSRDSPPTLTVRLRSLEREAGQLPLLVLVSSDSSGQVVGIAACDPDEYDR